MSIHVLCPECGTEFEINNDNEARALGPLDNGAYFLVPKSTNKIPENIMNAFLSNIKNARISDGNLVIPRNDNVELDPFAEFDANHPELTLPDLDDTEKNEKLDDIEQSIINDGYIPNTMLWRRWIMAQMLRHYKNENGESNFDKYFVSGKPYLYQWETILNEIKTLKKLSNQELTNRERFFNMDVIKAAAQDYEKCLSRYIRCKAKKYIDSNQKANKAAYVKLYYNKQRGRVYIDDKSIISNIEDTTFTELMSYVHSFVENILSCKTYAKMQNAIERLISNCPMQLHIRKAPSWKNAFKGAGAYYTMDNMIKFHDCGFFNESGEKLSTSDSLRILENKTTEYANEYYKLYALMQKFVNDNEFELSSILVADI